MAHPAPLKKMQEQTRVERASQRRQAPGPRCVQSGRIQVTDICSEVKTLSEMLLICERRYANALSAGNDEKAGRWAAAGEALLVALRPVKRD
ncbi:MAG TPA: hypothetical protein VM638_00285 [Actinomycetota bacterium]|nr:hypothetical protein [Actinomycetota bacterium]